MISFFRQLMKEPGCSDLCRCVKTDPKKEPEVECKAVACLSQKGKNVIFPFHCVYTSTSAFMLFSSAQKKLSQSQFVHLRHINGNQQCSKNLLKSMHHNILVRNINYLDLSVNFN